VRLPGADTLHAEWTKTRTVASTGWLLLAVIALTVAVGAAATAGTGCPPGVACQLDPAKVSLIGIDLGQAVVAIVAVLAISNEYSTGMIRITLSAMPRRTLVLAAKAAVITGLVLAAGTIAVLAAVLAGRLILSGHGFTPAHGYELLSLGHGPVLRAAAGSILYLALIAAFVIPMIGTAVVNLGILQFAYKPLLRRSLLAILITALGMSLLLQNTAELIWGPAIQAYPPSLLPSTGMFIGPVHVTFVQIALVAVSLALMGGLVAFVQGTTVGTAMRALAHHAASGPFSEVELPVPTPGPRDLVVEVRAVSVKVGVGLLHLLIQHTSASLALNENASPDVRRDFESWFNRAVPEGAAYWSHTLEGEDDMPAHIKAALLGPSLSLPVARGRLALGTWQGIYLCEHRDRGGSRRIVATLHGE